MQNGLKLPNKGFSKEMAVLTHFFQGYGINSSCSRLLTCMGSLWNKSETMKTLKKSKSKAVKKGKKGKRVIFKGDGSFDTLFSWL